MSHLQTRMVKAICGECAYTVRTTRRWLEELGPPLCPCNSGPMEVPDFAAWDQESWQRRQRAEAIAGEFAHSHTLKDKRISTRSVQECANCHATIHYGEPAQYKAYTVAGEFYSEYRCQNCADTGNPRGR